MRFPFSHFFSNRPSKRHNCSRILQPEIPRTFKFNRMHRVCKHLNRPKSTLTLVEVASLTSSLHRRNWCRWIDAGRFCDRKNIEKYCTQTIELWVMFSFSSWCCWFLSAQCLSSPIWVRSSESSWGHMCRVSKSHPLRYTWVERAERGWTWLTTDLWMQRTTCWDFCQTSNDWWQGRKLNEIHEIWWIHFDSGWK